MDTTKIFHIPNLGIYNTDILNFRFSEKPNFEQIETLPFEGGYWKPILYCTGIEMYCKKDGWKDTPYNCFRFVGNGYCVEYGDMYAGQTCFGVQFDCPKKHTFVVETDIENIRIMRGVDSVFQIISAELLETPREHRRTFVEAMRMAGFNMTVMRGMEEAGGLSYQTKAGHITFFAYGCFEVELKVAQAANTHHQDFCTYACKGVENLLKDKKFLTAHTNHFVRGDQFESKYITMT
jgi:hypothetical protein